ncbi:symporter small accessory protein [Metabacillus endolithicus]|uniref:Symporter small accessory protein n=1 Tax=Metabacillus endolithicus TaxID=1535204 RepID=A0ABW5C1E3_9BACI|nr:symporter small accessory protein [Metabacillus endolithicus]
MLGMEDITITFAWLATVLTMIGCVIYGVIMWNRGDDDEEESR